MQLTRLEIERFRNLKSVNLNLDQGLTVVAGGNGQGKSSLLEAVYLLGTGRSFRTRKLDDMVSWDGGPLVAAGQVTSRPGESRLRVSVDGGNRRLEVNEAPKGLEDYLGRLRLVDLTGKRMETLRGGPEERRRFVDRGIVGVNPGHLRTLGEYRRGLLQRNNLLRRGGIGQRQREAELEAWDDRLAGAATRLHLERRRYTDRLAGALDAIRGILFAHEARLNLRYAPSPREAGKADAERLSEVFFERLTRGRGRDIEMGHTCEGPHRDEIAVELDGVDLRRFGSAGQVRAAMITLKLGKLALLREEQGETPLFLMDDFDSDLDDGKMSSLAGFLHDGGFQTLVATSKESQVGRIDVSFVKLRMENGVARAA